MRMARRFGRIEVAGLGLWLVSLTAGAEAPIATQPTAEEAVELAPAILPPSEATPSAPPEGDIAALDLTELLNQPIVSASKRTQSLKDSPVSFSSITAEELEGTGAFTLCEAVQYFPGLECRRGAMRKSAVSARGLGSNFLSNRLLLLKDGRPETDPWTGVFYPDETTPLLNVQRIEVIRGPGSSLYGTNAFSGVINILTRKPEDLMREGRPYGADIRVLGGQHKTYRVQTTVAGKVGDVSGLVSYHGFRTDGPELLSDPARGVVDTNEDARVHQVNGKVLWKDLTLDVGYGESELGRPGGKHITTVGTCGRCHYTPDDRERVQGFQSSLTYQKKVSDNWEVFTEAYATFKRRVVELKDEFSGLLEPTLGKRRRVGAEARATFTRGEWAVTAGADAKSDGVNTVNVLPAGAGGIHATTLGAFVDGEWSPLEKWTLFAGARYDQPFLPEELWLRSEAHLSPRLALRYQALPELSLRTSYGRAFRAPSLAELAIHQQMYAATLFGNPELAAETLDVAELSVDTHPLGETLRLTATGFFKYASHLIGQQLVAGSSSRFANVGNARLWGLETEARVKVPRSPTVFHLAYQLLDANTVGSGGTPGAPLDYAPGHRVSLRAHTTVKETFFFDLYGLYVGTRNDPGLLTDDTGAIAGHVQLPDYFVASARAGTELAPGMTFSLLGTNIFDARYEESFGFPSPGLSLFGELRYVY